MTTLRTESVDCGSDGQMDMHVWTPAGGGRGTAIMLIQEILGVGSYIRAVAERLAGAGYVVGAPDVFWRFERNWEADHSEAGLGASIEKMQQLDFNQAIADCCTAFEHLKASSDVEGRPAVLGFCLGGTLAWAVAAAADPSACVSYYGSGVPDMLGLIDQVSCPTLFHFGSNDPYVAEDGIDRVAAAIAGRDGFVVNTEIAGHAFDNHEAAMFYNEPAAHAAWAKTMAFLHTHAPAVRA